MPYPGNSISLPVKPVNSQAKIVAGRSLTLLLEWWGSSRCDEPARESGRNERGVTYSGCTAQPDCTALRGAGRRSAPTLTSGAGRGLTFQQSRLLRAMLKK